MWDLPGPGIKPMSPALAGRFLTTVPPGKSLNFSFWNFFSLFLPSNSYWSFILCLNVVYSVTHHSYVLVVWLTTFYYIYLLIHFPLLLTSSMSIWHCLFSFFFFFFCHSSGNIYWLLVLFFGFLKFIFTEITLIYNIIYFICTTLYFYSCIPYSVPTTKNLVSIHHHTVDPLYPFHHPCPTPPPLVTTTLISVI